MIVEQMRPRRLNPPELDVLWAEVPKPRPARGKMFPGWWVGLQLVITDARGDGKMHFAAALAAVDVRRAGKGATGSWEWTRQRTDTGTFTHERFRIEPEDVDAFVAGHYGKARGPWHEVSLRDAVPLQHMLHRAVVRYLEYLAANDPALLNSDTVVVP